MNFNRCRELALLLAVAICFRTTSGQLLMASLLSGNSIITIEKNSSVECTTNKVSECLDCNSGIICMEENNKFVQIAKVTCPEGSVSPYCEPSTGLCTSVVPPKCSKTTFVCPNVDGTYPDPLNCTRYHDCASGNGVANDCPRNNVYDHKLGQCKFRRSNADCVNFNCANREGRTVVYPGDDRIWGKCINGKALILGRCKEYERFDVAQEKCVHVCRSVGNHPTDPFECQKYVYCGQVGINQYESTVMNCACNQGFDVEKRICTPTAQCYLDLNKTMCNVQKRSVDDEDAYDSIESYAADGTAFLPLDVMKREVSSSELIISGNTNADDQVSNGVDGNLINGDQNGDNENSGDALSRDDVLQLLPLIINSAGNGNTGNDVSNGDDNVNGNLVNGNGNGNNDGSGNVKLSAMIINNSGSGNTGNEVSNGNDDVDGNLVNGNENGDNWNSGNVRNPRLNSFIINNSGNRNKNNTVSNGDDNVDGNLVNGNGNGDNSNSGNVQNPRLNSFIINNSGNNNTNNTVSNGDDNVDGNLVNGNENGDNSNSGNVRKPRINPFIINNSGNNNNENTVSNGNDDVDGNLVNGNGNGDNSNSGNVENVHHPRFNSFVINNAGSDNSNNAVSNGNDDVDGNLVNGNGNGDNENSGNVNNKPDPRETILCWLRAIVRCISRLLSQA